MKEMNYEILWKSLKESLSDLLKDPKLSARERHTLWMVLAGMSLCESMAPLSDINQVQGFSKQIMSDGLTDR